MVHRTRKRSFGFLGVIFMGKLRHTIVAGTAALLLHLNGFTPSAWIAGIAQNFLSSTAKSFSAASEFTATGVRIRSGPARSTVVRGLGHSGDRAGIHHHVTGESVTCADGRTTADWFHVTDRRTSVTGYVSACFL